MEYELYSDRLIITQLSTADAFFIFELVNTAEWKQFIGDRNVNTMKDSENYISKIRSNENINYWTVRLKDSLVPIGIITFIKRDYLPYHDIGFAFLPQYGKKGYAFEAAKFMLDRLLGNKTHPAILASTLEENSNSIKLLQKLGFRFERELLYGEDKLQIYTSAKIPH